MPSLKSSVAVTFDRMGDFCSALKEGDIAKLEESGIKLGIEQEKLLEETNGMNSIEWLAAVKTLVLGLINVIKAVQSGFKFGLKFYSLVVSNPKVFRRLIVGVPLVGYVMFIVHLWRNELEDARESGLVTTRSTFSIAVLLSISILTPAPINVFQTLVVQVGYPALSNFTAAIAELYGVRSSGDSCGIQRTLMSGWADVIIYTAMGAAAGVVPLFRHVVPVHKVLQFLSCIIYKDEDILGKLISTGASWLIGAKNTVLLCGSVSSIVSAVFNLYKDWPKQGYVSKQSPRTTEAGTQTTHVKSYNFHLSTPDSQITFHATPRFF